MKKFFILSILAVFLGIFSQPLKAQEKEKEIKNTSEEHILKIILPIKEKKKERVLEDETIGDVIFGKEIEILVTGYSSTVDQCDSDPLTTASGTTVHLGTMACPPEYAFGTTLEIEGKIFVCEDRGGKIKGKHFDRWFKTRGEALAWGKRMVKARINM